MLKTFWLILESSSLVGLTTETRILNFDSFSTVRWINRDLFSTLDSFSTADGSIELFFSFLLICPLTNPRQLHLSTPFCSTPGLTLISTLARHLSIYQAFQLPLIAISIASCQLGGLIEISSGPLIAFRQLVDRSSFFLAFYWFVHRQFHLSTPFCSTPGLTPFDTFICRDLLSSYLSANRDFPLIFLNLSLDRLAWFQHLILKQSFLKY